jgi:hypothetical protein
MPTTGPRSAWFRMGPDLNMRVSDAERAEVADRLSRHYADGRLDQAEFDERVSRAMAAKTVSDLRGLFDDLPDLPGDIPDDNADDTRAYPGAGRAAGMSPAAGCATARRGPMRGPVRALLMVALIVVAANIAWHAVGFWISPVAWLVIIAAIIVAFSRHSRRSGK